MNSKITVGLLAAGAGLLVAGLLSYGSPANPHAAPLIFGAGGGLVTMLLACRLGRGSRWALPAALATLAVAGVGSFWQAGWAWSLLPGFDASALRLAILSAFKSILALGTVGLLAWWHHRSTRPAAGALR